MRLSDEASELRRAWRELSCDMGPQQGDRPPHACSMAEVAGGCCCSCFMRTLRQNGRRLSAAARLSYARAACAAASCRLPRNGARLGRLQPPRGWAVNRVGCARAPGGRGCPGLHARRRPSSLQLEVGECLGCVVHAVVVRAAAAWVYGVHPCTGAPVSAVRPGTGLLGPPRRS